MESKSPKIIEWPGLQHIEDNPDLYLDMLLKDIVFVFRNANLDIDEQYELHRTLGKIFNGFPNKTEGGRDEYIEDHARLNKGAGDDTGDDIRVPWHQEHFNYTNSIIYGNWNNEIFNIDKKNGKTYFYDMCKFYKTLPDDTKEFLKKCIADAGGSDPAINDYALVNYHWITNEPVLRMPFWGKYKLNNYDGRPSTKMEQTKFTTIMNDILSFVTKDEKNRIVHEWQQGDLVVSDLYKCAHAVTGGFDSKDRKFIGMFGHAMPSKAQ